MRPRVLQVVVLTVAAAVVSGCGDDDDTPDAAPTPVATVAPAKPAPPPAELVGTYTVKLAATDLPDPAPPELAGSRNWTVRVTTDGGVDDAPTLSLFRDETDALESSTLTVKDDQFILTGQPCAKKDGGYAIVTSTYRFELTGRSLRLQTVEAGCEDRVEETILTSRALRRAG